MVRWAGLNYMYTIQSLTDLDIKYACYTCTHARNGVQTWLSLPLDHSDSTEMMAQTVGVTATVGLVMVYCCCFHRWRVASRYNGRAASQLLVTGPEVRWAV